MIYAQQERQRFWIECFFATLLIAGGSVLIYFMIIWAMSVRGG